MTSPKIIFMGTPEFSVPSLNILIENNLNIIAVVTTQDKPQGRGLIIEASDIKKFALSKNIPVIQPENLKDETFIQEIKNLDPDIIVVVAFRILPREIYSLAKLGAFNLHASLLPKYRGAAPINWAIINGESETGVTTFFLEEKVDTGNIIFQERVAIDENETAGELHDKLSVLGSELVLKTVNAIIEGNVVTSKQDNRMTSPAPKIFKEDCHINWEKKSKDVHNFIRGLSPYPAALTEYRDKLVKIYRTEIIPNHPKGKPGQIVDTSKDLIVSTKDSAIKILEIQLEGRKRMLIKEFLRGSPIQDGEFFDF
jgi:methionyl-tRNA formyltransferase